MYRLLEDHPGARRLLLANEAIARGALEAGVAYVTAYPGTPSTEVSEALSRAARESERLYFEYSTNEKVALEVAAGAAWGGRRALTAMKQVGLNVAADPLLTLGAVGVIGGLVLVTADDPSQHSSQTEQDSRHYARLADVPMLEPASADEARRMTVAAFALSEDLGFPVLLRTTTRLSHLRGVVTLGPLAPVRPPPEVVARDPRRFVNLPANAPVNRTRHLATLARAAALADDCEWNKVTGEAELGVVASGIGRAYVRDALRDLGLADRVALLEVGWSWPFPRGLLAKFLLGKRRVLVVEELEPFVEQEIQRAAHARGGELQVLGKGTGHFGPAFEYTPVRVAEALAELADGPRPGAPPRSAAVAPPPAPPPLLAALPRRPPVLCAGCAHRASFYAAAVATGGRALFENDIGCYTLGYGPPFDQAQHLICMGGAINLASALSRQTADPVFAYVGDSTFFHSGITGLINAVHNGYKFVVVVLDNLTTAMTGHQPHPGTASRDGRSYQPVEIEALARASGARLVEVVNPMQVEETVAAMRRAIETDGMAVVISRAPCALLRDAEPWHEPRSYRVVEQDCCSCGCTPDGKPCAVPLDAAEKRFRSERRILSGKADDAARARPELPALAPCSAACPAGICAQGYVNHLACGRPLEALKLIRERVALPGVLGHVCHHPCESACERGRTEAPLPIRELKRYAATFDEPPETHWLRARAAAVPDTGKRVAVVGSGPAGLQCAAELRLRGHRVTVFERAPVAGGLPALAIPPFRLPRTVLRRELAVLEALGIEFRCNTAVTRDPRGDGFDAVFLAVGAGRTRRLDIPGEDGPGIVDALELLEALALERPFRPGERVVVVGGGNAAIDAARAALRLGAREARILYRRGEAELPALA
ncbi:MAG: FAD-dependent oxidoreductase, partial [Deltaproteobacteria bacterium]|nr:FAD-dependent oxidoreductase [Deltaproteobacteria bacterium]